MANVDKLEEKLKKAKKVLETLDEIGLKVKSDNSSLKVILDSDKEQSGTLINIDRNENLIIQIHEECPCYGHHHHASDSPIIETLQQVAEVLEDLGYNVKSHDDAVHIAVGGTDNPFVAVITINEQNELVITCQVAKLGDLNEDEIPTVQFYLLDANTRIRPFAFGIITASDDPEYDDAADYPIVLTDSIPLGDLCEDELTAAMDSLLVALKSSDEALRIGLES